MICWTCPRDMTESVAHLVDVAAAVTVAEVVALRPGGECVLGAPLVDVVADEGVHGHVEEAGLLIDSGVMS